MGIDWSKPVQVGYREVDPDWEAIEILHRTDRHIYGYTATDPEPEIWEFDTWRFRNAPESEPESGPMATIIIGTAYRVPVTEIDEPEMRCPLCDGSTFESPRFGWVWCDKCHNFAYLESDLKRISENKGA